MNAESRRQELYHLLGDLPERDVHIGSRRIAGLECEHYLLEKLVLRLNGIEDVPAYFVKPKSGEGPFPTVLFNHSHGGNYRLGKDELLRGNVYLSDPPYAEELTALGYAVLCIDAWGFGERRGRTESELFKEMLWNGQVLWGMMVFDSLRAVDYLLTRDDVDVERIGTLGMSMGSTMAWWTAALDPRIRVCIEIGGLTDYQALIETRGLDQHGIYYYVPGLLKAFTTAQINALIAPRPHLGIAGIYDPLTPPRGLEAIDAELREVYRAAGAPDAWKLLRYATGHFETQEMRFEVVQFLRERL
jgi:dienelactone hydrolase